MLSGNAIVAAVRTSANRISGSLSPHLDAVVLVASAALLAYLVGIATGYYQLPPFGWLQQQWRNADDWREHWRSNLGIEPTRLLARAERDGAGVVLDVAGKTQPGVTLMSSVFDDRSGLRLFDHEGQVIHAWPISFADIMDDGEAERQGIVAHTDWEIHVHGSALLPDGDVIMTVENGIATLRMDPCGAIKWKVFRRNHHAVFVADDGNIWTLGRVAYRTPLENFPGMTPPIVDDLVLEISPDGEILREISLLELLYQNQLFGALFPPGIEASSERLDILHTNDIEILSAKHAAAFPMFEAGDAMVSFRDLSLIVVFDPDTRQIKWSRTGPWMQQHDPDFLPDGRIAVFDNRPDPAGGRALGGSRIVAVDPASNEVEVLYQGTEENPFYTGGRGKVQALENGNLLITETSKGRVFEVTPEGETVWTFINRYDEDQVGVVNGALRYPASYASFDTAHCGPGQQAGMSDAPAGARGRSSTAARP